MRLYASRVPIIPEALTFASQGFIPAGSKRNRRFCSGHIDIAAGVDPLLIDVLADAQTSGGLLISVPENKTAMLVQRLQDKNTPVANVIGEVISEPIGMIKVSK
jgi:selenide,water dikinase